MCSKGYFWVLHCPWLLQVLGCCSHFVLDKCLFWAVSCPLCDTAPQAISRCLVSSLASLAQKVTAPAENSGAELCGCPDRPQRLLCVVTAFSWRCSSCSGSAVFVGYRPDTIPWDPAVGPLRAAMKDSQQGWSSCPCPMAAD